jgi:hypothetical protein
MASGLILTLSFNSAGFSSAAVKGFCRRGNEIEEEGRNNVS